jgi:sulfur-oxidizing protein SoxA
MKASYQLLLIISVFICSFSLSTAGPVKDKAQFQNHFIKMFPGVPKKDFSNGLYAIDKNLRQQWMSIEDFPPYVIAVDEGKVLLNKKFKNGRSIASCFKKRGVGIANHFPYFDVKKNKVVTLALAINMCRQKNGEKKWKYKKGKIASVLAYMAYTSRGKIVNVANPAKNSKALRAYRDGQNFYFAKRGQLNMSCANCHIDNVGLMLRANLLGPGLGQVTHMPVYRSKWGSVGTLHRRFAGCNKQVRAKPLKAQGEKYRNLEYFMTYMSNGLPWNGPGARF